MKNIYKLSIIAFGLLLNNPAHAELGFNEQTRKFYSIGAKNKVDQNEYHNLVVSMFTVSKKYRICGDDMNAYKSIEKMLEKHKTHASKRLLSELKDGAVTIICILPYILTFEEIYAFNIV